MPEFLGTENSIAVQKRLRERQTEIAQSPDLVNGGRILHFLQPEKTGWARVRELANEDRLAGFPLVRREDIVSQIERHLGPQWKVPAWDALTGSADRVLRACESVIASVALPDGCESSTNNCPDEDTIALIQSLNSETGVAPYPAYYTRSEAVSVLTACILDRDGSLVATASVADRYHAAGRLGGHVFAGMVSVAGRFRGRGLGKLVNAIALVESHRRFGWEVATEQVAPDNPASKAMIMACGLDHSDGLSSVAAINSDESFSR